MIRFILFVFALMIVACSSDELASLTSPVIAEPGSVPPGQTFPDPDQDPLPGEEPEPAPPPAEAGNCVDTRTDFAYREQIEELCELVNVERAKAGVKPLKLYIALSEVAQDHAFDMATNGYFSHTSLDGRSPFQRMKDAGISYTYAGENIARGYTTPAQAMNGWMNSSGHKANILNSKYGRVGLGFYQNYWVQDFMN